MAQAYNPRRARSIPGFPLRPLVESDICSQVQVPVADVRDQTQDHKHEHDGEQQSPQPTEEPEPSEGQHQAMTIFAGGGLR
jgi:hypothetical protein